MTTIKHTLTFLFSVLCCFALQAQLEHQHEELPINVKSLPKMKHRANYALKSGDAYTALFYYEEIVKLDTADNEALFQLAELQRFTRNYEEAEKSYAKVYAKEPRKYTIAHYYQGVMLKMSDRPEEAKEQLIKFKQESRGGGDKVFKRHLLREIVGCDTAITLKEFPENVLITNAGQEVNHPHIEYSPVMLDTNNMMFGSLVADSLHFFDVSFDNAEPQPKRQLYTVHRTAEGWQQKSLFNAINDSTMHMGDFAVSPNGKNIYFTKCEKNAKDIVVCKLYVSQKIKGKYTAPELLPEPINIDGYNSTQPTVAYDTARKKEYLYFVSDRPEGKGGYDIWFTFYDTRKRGWRDPINLGGYINTPDMETTPYFHQATGEFYFSSDGHATMGGLDVFKTKKEGRKWEKPQNIGYPLNSAQDDIGFYIANDGQYGMLVSNRKGGTPYFHETCCDDIYEFRILPPKPFDCDLHLMVSSEDTSGCEGKRLQITSTDSKTKNLIEMDTVLANCDFIYPLDRRHEYTFTIHETGFEDDTLKLTTKDQCASEEIQKELALKIIREPEPEIPKEKPTEEAPFVLKDVHYESDKAELTDEAKKSLKEVLIPYLKSHPEATALIASHTDHVGSKKYNEDLSQRRAENVVKYLIKNGIPKDKLVAKGFGETKPIAPNTNPDGTHNEIGMSLNRRTEFSFVAE